MARLQSILFAKPISCPDWGGQKARSYVTDEEAEISLDLDGRIATLKPKRGAPVIIPLENVVQWKPLNEPKQPSEPKPSRKTSSLGT